MTTVSLLITGNEVRDGLVPDRNTCFLAQQLRLLGFSLSEVRICGDEADRLADNISQLARGSRCLIVSGGLGPTPDDLTRAVLSSVSGQPLVADDTVLTALKDRFARRGRYFDPTNRKQALFPEGAEIIPNPGGTAPGFALEHQGSLIICLPGVPAEMESMWPYCRQLLHSRFSAQPQRYHCTLSIFGLSESQLAGLVQQQQIPTSIIVSYSLEQPGLRLSLESSAPIDPDLVSALKQRIGSAHIFSAEGHTLAAVVINGLQEQQLTIAGAESCTGGLIAKQLTDCRGASQVFLGSLVVYSNSSKVALLAVPPAILDRFGAVSAECAQALTMGAARSFAADCAFAVTGIAGPDGATPAKPIGLCYLGLLYQKQIKVFAYRFSGDSRQLIRQQAAGTMLDLIRRTLHGYAVSEPILATTI